MYYAQATVKPLSIILEFARTSEPQDPHAFRFESQVYTRRTAGGGIERFRIEWDEELLIDLAALREPQCDPALTRRLGERLRQALKSADWSTVEAQLAKCIRDDRRVLVTVRSNAAELYALPWELVTVGAAGAHLGGLPGVVVRYEWPKTDTTPPSTNPRPEGGPVLVAWSAAGGEVPNEEHIDAIEQAYRDGFVDFDRKRDVLANASARSLDEALSRATSEGRPYALLHLLAHGGSLGSTFGLILDGPASNDAIDAGRLCRLLSPYAGTLRLVTLAACDSGNIGTLGNHMGSLAQALHRRGVQSVVASRYPLSATGSIALTRTLYHSLLVELCPLEQAFAAARDRLSREGGLDWASIQLYARAADGEDTRPVVFRPYRGLEVFEAQHRRLFFGRDAEIEEAVREISALRSSDAPRLYFVSGASGSGKSSLIRAGVVPNLDPKLFATVHIARPSDCENDIPDARPLLLILDQAEELFTTLDQNSRRQLITRLHTLATDRAGSVVVFTLRADFIGHCGEIALPSGRRLDRFELDEKHRLFVPLMNPQSMVDAVTGPARAVGLEIQSSLAEELVEKVAGDPGALPLLEFALDRMWQNRGAKGLTLDGLRALGGAVEELLEREADAAIAAMDSREAARAERLLVALVALGDDQRPDTRRKRRLRDLRSKIDPVFEKVLTCLASARLVVTYGKPPAQYVELVHEELIRRWGQLKEWIKREKQRDARRRRTWLLAALTIVGSIAVAALAFYVQARSAAALADQAAANEKQAKNHLANQLRKSHGLRASILAKVPEREREAARLAIIAAGPSLDPPPPDAVLEGLRLAAYHGSRTRVLKGHTSSVNALAFSPDGQRIVTGSDDNTSSVWNASSGKRIQILEGHFAPVTAVAFSPNGQRIATASRHTARVWDPSFGVRVLKGHTTVTFSPNSELIATAGDDFTVRVWDASSGALLRTLDGHTKPVTDALFSPNGQLIATVSRDRTVRVWDPYSGQQTNILKHPTNTFQAIAYSPNGQHIAAVGTNGHTWLWEPSSDKHFHLKGHTDDVQAVAYSPDGSLLATASIDKTARVWDAESKTQRHSLDIGAARELALAFSPDSQHLAVSNFPETQVWGTYSGSRLYTIEGDEAVFSPDGERIATVATGAAVSVSDARRNEFSTPFATNAVTFSPNGSLIVIAGDKTAQVWSADFGELLHVLKGHSYPIWGVAFSTDGERIATASYDKTARVWDASSGAQIFVLEGHSGEVTAVAFSPDNRRVATASSDKTARVWDASYGAHLYTLRDHSSGVNSVVFSSNGKWIATASSDKTARVWDASSGTHLVSLEGHSDEVTSVAFSPNGTLIATASSDKTARVWDPLSGWPLLTLKGHTGEVTAVSFSHKGERIATASRDGTVRVWDASSGTQVHALKGHTEGLSAVVFSPNDQHIATASSDNTVRLWDASPQLWLHRCCEIIFGLDTYFDDEVSEICEVYLDRRKFDVMNINFYGLTRPDNHCSDRIGKKLHGCPDDDGDGIFAFDDKCPADPGPKPHGCPDKDGDSVPFHLDSCPGTKGVTPHGCVDKDRDGIPDIADQCDEDPESENGFKDEDGCHDETPRLTQFPDIEFYYDTDRLLSVSEAALDAFVKSLEEFPDLKFEISGHTDNVRDFENSKEFSLRRANTVKAYLIEQGVDAERIETRGAGMDEPIASNRTAAGRAKNTRVEFTFIYD